MGSGGAWAQCLHLFMQEHECAALSTVETKHQTPSPPCRLTVVWFLGSTTPSVFSLVGSLNKAPTALLGMLLFRTPTTPQSLLSILLGLVSGVVFVVAKSRGG